MDIFSEIIGLLTDGQEITFTPKNVDYADDFLIFNKYHPTITCTFKQSGWGVWWVLFDGDEPMKLEDCPETFYWSIYNNIK